MNAFNQPPHCECQLKFRLLHQSERYWLHREHMTRDFPRSELKPADMLDALARKGINQVYGCFDTQAQTLVGYYVLAQQPTSNLILLDYLAILPDKRGAGVGSAVLAHIRQTLCPNQYLFIETENPEAAQSEQERLERLRRIQFYHRNGAIPSALKVLLFGVDFAVQIIPSTTVPTPAEQERDYVSLYQQMLPASVCAKRVLTTLPAGANHSPNSPNFQAENA